MTDSIVQTSAGTTIAISAVLPATDDARVMQRFNMGSHWRGNRFRRVWPRICNSYA